MIVLYYSEEHSTNNVMIDIVLRQLLPKLNYYNRSLFWGV